MKEFPSVEKTVLNIPIYAYDKLDGSNIRVEWSRKRGFYKFGTRHRLLGADEAIIGESHELIRQHEAVCTKILKREGVNDNAVFFFEFLGNNSFSGTHQQEEHRVVLIDVSLYKVGLIDPKDLAMFKDIPSAPLLYKGKPSGEFLDQVRNSTLPGMTFEGVVCKANVNKKRVMFKVKSMAWLDKLHNFCKGDDKLFNELE